MIATGASFHLAANEEAEEALENAALAYQTEAEIVRRYTHRAAPAHSIADEDVHRRAVLAFEQAQPARIDRRTLRLSGLGLELWSAATREPR